MRAFLLGQVVIWNENFVERISEAREAMRRLEERPDEKGQRG